LADEDEDKEDEMEAVMVKAFGYALADFQPNACLLLLSKAYNMQDTLDPFFLYCAENLILTLGYCHLALILPSIAHRQNDSLVQKKQSTLPIAHGKTLSDGPGCLVGVVRSIDFLKLPLGFKFSE